MPDRLTPDDEDVERGAEDAARDLLPEAAPLTEVVAHPEVVLHRSGALRAGEKIGPYRVEHLIGQGGMGAVYAAVREDDFRKCVAIKIVKVSFDSPFARRRFEQERQILARFDHPHIARLLDGGEREGAPYLVMEFVDGQPLLAAASTLDTTGKLRLFRQVLSGVGYAHRQLIVHRDLKPGNILVLPGGEPKLLDFGIARLLDDEGGEPGSHTMTAAALMTPDYASPEQVTGEPAGVASDIYSLGAILFELLTGAKPHRLESYSTAEIFKAICEVDPLPPSRAAPAPRARELRGDLDTLVLHALAKDPNARYESAEAFSADIERFLDGRPLAVRPASALERTLKFVRRNRLVVAGSLALAASLIGGITVSTIQARRAQRRFAQVRELANTFLFQFYDQVTPLPGSTAVRASIVQTARKYLEGLSAEAGNDRDLMLELAQAWQRLGDVQGRTGGANLGQVEQARQSYLNAVALYERLGLSPRVPADLRRRAASALLAAGRLEYNAYRETDAEPLTRRALDLLATGDPEPATRMLRATGERDLGDIRLRLGQTAAAVTLMESSRRTLIELRSSGYVDPDLTKHLGITHEKLARAHVSTGDLDRALGEFIDLLASSAPCLEQGAPNDACRTLAVRLGWTGDVLAALDRPNLGEPGKAVPYYEQSVRIAERVAASDDHDRQAQFNLAARYGKLGDAVWQATPERALELYERALETARTLASKEQLAILEDSYQVAVSRPLIALGRLAEARAALSGAIERGRTAADAPYPDRLGDLQVRTLWPALLVAEGKRNEARHALDGLVREIDALRVSHPDDLTPTALLSEVLRQLAAMTSGEDRRSAVLRSAAAWQAWIPGTSYTTREAQRDLASAASAEQRTVNR